MDKSIRFLEEARQMVGLKLWDLAANRFYYSCFHAAQALLLEYGFSAQPMKELYLCLAYIS